LPRTMIRSSFGAIRIQQRSHHILSSALGFSTFGFTDCPDFIWFWHRRPLLGLSATFRRFDCALPRRFSRTQRLTPSISVLSRRVFLSFYCFPQFANASSVVDLGFSLTIKAGTVTIFSRHTALFEGQHRHATEIYMRILLEVFDRHEEDSPGMNRRR
jgi:hypothetical protein